MNTGVPAFPQHGWSKDPQVLERMRNQGGMTLLDWFAGQALTGILADSESQGEPEEFAAAAYNLATAMLAERARREAVVKESSTTDHSGDAGKMVELEAQNRELLERIKRLEDVLEKAELAVAFANREHGVIRMMADDYTEVLQQIRVALKAKEAKP